MEGGQGAQGLCRAWSARLVPSSSSSSHPPGKLPVLFCSRESHLGGVQTGVPSREWVHMGAHSKGGSILCTHLGADVPVCTHLSIFVLF